MTRPLHYPYTTVWHGRVMAEGWFLPFSSLPEDEIRQRLLMLWAPGVRLYRVDDGYLAIMQNAVAVDCAASPAWPLCRQGNGLSSVPLSPSDARSLSAGQIALIIGGIRQTIDLSHCPPVNPGLWLDLDNWIMADPIPPLSLISISPQARDLHEILQVSPLVQKLDDIFAVRRPAGNSFFRNLLDRLRGAFHWRRTEPQTSNPPSQTPAKRTISPFWMVVIFLILAKVIQSLVTSPSATPAPNASEPPQAAGLPPWVDQLLIILMIIFVVIGCIWLLRQIFGTALHRADQDIARITGQSAPPRPPGLLQRLFQRWGSSPSQAGSATSSPGFWRRLSRWWRGSQTDTQQVPTPQGKPQDKPFNRRLMNSQIGRLLAGRQARYMRRMLQMFDDDDLDNALRYAIPLGNSAGDSHDAPALGVPDPRREIAISLQRGVASMGYNFGHDFYEHLRKMYLRALEQLLQQGNIERAVFVQAELLEDVTAAAELLDQHGQTHRAAELAEARGEPAQAIRLWLKAGDTQRAVHIAQRYDAYQAAIRLMEQHNQHEPAALLRQMYAEALSASGDYESAVDTLWPLPGQDARLQPLLAAGLALDGTAGIRMLARQTLLQTDDIDPVIKLFQGRLEDDSVQTAELRFMFAETLNGLIRDKRMMQHHPSTPLARSLLRQTCRYLVQDAQRGWITLSKKKYGQWLRSCEDGVLRDDSPSLPKFQTIGTSHQELPQQTAPAICTIDLPPGLAVHDAALCMGDAIILALGEAGIELIRIDSHGKRVLRRFSCPADRIIVSANGLRALAIATREHASIITVLELDSGRSRLYGSLKLDWYAREYDGRCWVTYDGSRIQLFDMQTESPSVLWNVSDLPGPCVWASANANNWQFLFVTPHQKTDGTQMLEHWRYLEHGRRLAGRNQHWLSLNQSLTFDTGHLSPSCLWPQPDQPEQYIQHLFGYEFERIIDLKDLDMEHISSFDSLHAPSSRSRYGEPLVVIALKHSSYAVVQLCTALDYQQRDSSFVPANAFIFHHGRDCHFRLYPDQTNRMLAWDDMGRVIVVDLVTRHIITQFSA